jgi:hypothetical protein
VIVISAVVCVQCLSQLAACVKLAVPSQRLLLTPHVTTDHFTHQELYTLLSNVEALVNITVLIMIIASTAVVAATNALLLHS